MQGTATWGAVLVMTGVDAKTAAPVCLKVPSDALTLTLTLTLTLPRTLTLALTLTLTLTLALTLTLTQP